jgi:hypothetical protein
MFPGPIRVIDNGVLDLLVVSSLHLDRDGQPLWSLRRLDDISIPPISNRVLGVVVKDEFVNGVDQIKVAPPWDIVGLNDRDRLAHAA